MAKKPADMVVDKQTMDALKFIVEETKKDIPQIGYDLFVRDYLPLLAAPPERNSAGDIVPRNLSLWMEICKHASNSVQVLNRDGTVRFTVPPLVGTIPTYYPMPRTGLAAIATEAQFKNSQHPVLGERFLNNALSTSLTDQALANKAQTLEWNNVLVEHGYEPLPGYGTSIVKAGESVAAPAPQEPQRVITDDDYDDL
ncbi:hypothetical protein pEaSNUABM54_00283 [Erwinia phage pEa_SNUABM_54]|nr:hypothetical protein pEaSNUABM54_00283 [Erwinia phage pEa_SNUABM_54]